MTDKILAAKVASRFLATETVDLIAAVSGDHLLGVKDVIDRKFQDPANWPYAGQGFVFSVYLLRQVPLKIAEDLADVGTPASPYTPRAAWQVARRYAQRPIATYASPR